MGHPVIKNKTPFDFQPLFITDEDGRLLLVPIVKATFAIGERRVALAEEPLPVNFEGESWGDPESSSYKYEPETAFAKVATDVVLIGHAHGRAGGVRQIDVELRVGPLKKTVRVTGDRHWIKRPGRGVSISKPKPFERMPLVYERAFGGWDRRDADPEKPTCEPRNPVGVGFLARKSHVEDGQPLPNIEDPKDLLRKPGQTPQPAGFGFTSPHWQPRAELAGTYDEVWQQKRMPLLPKDFDRRFFSAAPGDLIAPGYLKGDERVMVRNVTLNGLLAFDLPGIAQPVCLADIQGQGEDLEIPVQLDTVIINADDNLLILLWRGQRTLHSDPLEVTWMQVEAPGVEKWIRKPC